jgi:broad specificity phosphatase PhoE
MTLRVCLIAQGATASTRNAAFPADDPLLDATAAPAVLPRVLRRWAGAEVRVSPRLAARQTAARFGLTGACVSDLADLDCGRWAGRAIAEVAAAEPEALRAWMTDPAFKAHGGESRTELSLRVAGWLQSLTERDGGVLAVTHAAVIRSLVLAVLQAPAEAFWRLDIAPLTLTDLRHDGRRWTLRGLGNSSYGERGPVRPAPSSVASAAAATGRLQRRPPTGEG